MDNFDQAIADLDLKLFEKINSQSSDQDKRSLLACQLATRELRPDFNYLEIGSYLGGSIQPYLPDDRCKRIYSIDKRPKSQPDERRIEYVYLNNSTVRMLENLRAVAPDKMDKIVAIDSDTRTIDQSMIPDSIHLAFIDGEHTNDSVMSDFMFCLEVLDPNGGAVMFHDAQITYNGLADCVKYLQQNRTDFRAYILPHIVFVIEIGIFPLHKNARIAEMLVNNHEGYLFSLQNNDYYREFTNKLPFRLIRNFMSRMKKNNVSQ